MPQLCHFLPRGLAALAGLAITGLVAAQEAQGAPSCKASSGAQAPLVVELYTSEGCSSCPPADRWLSTLVGRADVLALGFHVNYWDRLGWPDRFASAEATARQHELARRAGARQVYTPQVVAQGQDWRDWPRLPAQAVAQPASTPSLQMQRHGDQVSVTVAASAGAAAGERLSGYWAVLEDRHLTQVRAGENQGQSLRHDHVVRLYRPVSAWPARQSAQWQLQVSPGVAEHPRRVVFVVTDAASLRPLQALALGC